MGKRMSPRTWIAPRRPITLREAYAKGRRSRWTASDWDELLERFSRRYCGNHPASMMCALEHAWADGFDDAGENVFDRRPDKDE